MGVTLMADIPDYLVSGGIKDPVQGDGKFHHPQIGSQMPAVAAYGANYLFPYFIRKQAQFTKIKPCKIPGIMYGRQKKWRLHA
jgi:hypothetical protein